MTKKAATTKVMKMNNQPGFLRKNKKRSKKVCIKYVGFYQKPQTFKFESEWNKKRMHICLYKFIELKTSNKISSHDTISYRQ
jgi:hypothetical protein